MGAFEAWINARLVSKGEEEISVRYIAESSEQTYREYAWALDKFFAHMTLKQIHDGHLRSYQDDRARCNGSWKNKCGQNRIHKEVAMLLRILRAAHLWSDDLDDAFDQLPMEQSDLPRAMDAEEQAHWMSTCRSNSEWAWVHQYCILALQTCASTFELRMARLVDINLRHWTFRVGPEASKNKFRNRTIPLETEEAKEAAEGLVYRAQNEFGSRLPGHYVLPFGANSRRGDLDVTQPMTKFGLKGPWNKVREKSGIRWLRPYDMRHTAITNMATKGIPIAVIMSFSGHISPKMQQHYTTISMQAKREAAIQAWPKMPPSSVVLMNHHAVA